MPTELLSSLTRRPWLDLYSEGSFIARRLGEAAAAAAAADSDPSEADASFASAAVPIELWLHVLEQLSLGDFAAVCHLGSTCHGLRPLARHAEVWRRLCGLAYREARGFLPCAAQLRLYGWSWRTMFMRRRRLRFDGLYYLTTVKLIHGLNEGRGMKEADKDFYHAGARARAQCRMAL